MGFSYCKARACWRSRPGFGRQGARESAMDGAVRQATGPCGSTSWAEKPAGGEDGQKEEIRRSGAGRRRGLATADGAFYQGSNRVLSENR